MVPPPSSATGELTSPFHPELSGLIPHSLDNSQLGQGTLAGPLNEPILSTPATQEGGRAGAGGVPSDLGSRVSLRTRDYTFYCNGSYTENSPAQQDTVIGYPANGSIATFTPDRKGQNDRIFIPDVMRRYPPEETGTGRVKFHTQRDGSRVSYCGTIRPDENGLVAACSNKPYDHQIVGIPNSCKRRGCPECSPDWSHMASKRVQQSVNGYILATVPEQMKKGLLEALAGLSGEAPPDEWKQLDQIQDILTQAYRYLSRHIVISPSREAVAAIVERTERTLKKNGINIDKDHIRYRNEFHRVFMKKYRRKLDQVVRAAGIDAYIDVDHNIRLKDFRESVIADREYDKNRYREVLTTPHWRHQVRFSPHSHLMAWGYLIPVKEFYERTGGWVYKNLGVVSSVAGLSDYLLSHAPDIAGMHSYRTGGNLKNYRVQGEIKIPVFRKCLECIEEGKAVKDAGMVLAKLQSVEYKRDKDRQNKMISWEFQGGLSDKPYRTTEIIQVYDLKPPGQRKPGTPGEDPPPTIGAWISEEDRERQLCEWRLLKKERERIRRSNLWMSFAQWEKLPAAERQRFKWRKYFSQESYAEAGPEWLIKMFEWS